MIAKGSRRFSEKFTLLANTKFFGLIKVASAFAAFAAYGAFVHNIDAGKVEIQSRWTYSWEAAPDDMVEMATTPAVQDSDVSLMLACSGNGRLSVALMHADYFPFEVDGSSSVQVQSPSLSRTSGVVERGQTAQIVFDSTLMQHIMSLLAEAQEMAISVTAKDGVVHRYTFALQPNDLALAPLRERCWAN